MIMSLKQRKIKFKCNMIDAEQSYQATTDGLNIDCHRGAVNRANFLIHILLHSFSVYILQNVVQGSQASPVYSLMLRCSQKAPQSLRTTCYSLLGTLEILGKQLSLFLAGVFAEVFGYSAGLSISLAVSLLVVLLVWCCPKQLRNN